MDIVEVPSHFMENFVCDARTLQLFMPKRKGDRAGAKKAEALAQQIKEDRHLLGALDLELQVCLSWSLASFQNTFYSCMTPSISVTVHRWNPFSSPLAAVGNCCKFVTGCPFSWSLVAACQVVQLL